MTFLCHVGPKQHWHAGDGRSEWWEETLKHMDQQWKTNISAATDDQHRLTSLFLLHSRPGVSSAFPFFSFPPLSHPSFVCLCGFFFFIKHSASFGGIKRGEVAGKGDEDEKKNNKFSSLSFSCSADWLTIVMFFFTSSILYVFSRVGLFTSCPAPLSPTSGGRLRIQTHQLNSRGLWGFVVFVSLHLDCRLTIAGVSSVLKPTVNTSVHWGAWMTTDARCRRDVEFRGEGWGGGGGCFHSYICGPWVFHLGSLCLLYWSGVSTLLGDQRFSVCLFYSVTEASTVSC